MGSYKYGGRSGRHAGRYKGKRSGYKPAHKNGCLIFIFSAGLVGVVALSVGIKEMIFG